MDETGQSVRRVAEEQRYDHRLLQNVLGTLWEPNPGDVSTDLPEPKRITVTTKEPATSTSVKQILKSLVTRQNAQPAKFTAPDCRGRHRGMQEKTLRRDDDRRIHSDPNLSNTCERNRTCHQRSG